MTPYDLLTEITWRLNAQPPDAELARLQRHAKEVVAAVFPYNNAGSVGANEKAAYQLELEQRVAALPSLFSNAGTEARALRNLVICLHCIERLRDAHVLDWDEANRLKGRVLTAYVHHAPQVTKGPAP
jgi:hypothetical protein